MKRWQLAIGCLVGAGVVDVAVLLVVFASARPVGSAAGKLTAATTSNADLRPPGSAPILMPLSSDEAKPVVVESLAVLEAKLTGGDYAAAARVVREFSDDENRLQWMLRVAAAWSCREPAAAANFASTLPTEAERRAVLAAVIDDWAERDVTAAGAWLGGQQFSADHDGAIAALARRAGTAGAWPELMLTWADNIGDRGVRWEVIREGVQAWALRDESAARHYVETAPGLSPAQRAQLRERVTQRTTLLD